ncbi:hypothetical protein CK501_08360 [Halovibrio salipaludis]|uniref:Filamentous haemagglutinin FhaB/tRNA nuclease CdiA-like TPS domain-containing protein n=1 Tax=Halovibrio salipaludis TaxID=2032626 RepID=A0A2A2F722_9GAMM|nr:filamentous hemagglutinin N-terminal domain-containing protein [Halovibrio salipaludis]PAU80449.1 hypothetical protein CK501_08360 [Halovibrio salipaludis]
MRFTFLRHISYAFALLMAGGGAVAAPEGGDVVLGRGSIDSQGGNTQITQSSDKLAVDWDSFSIADGERVEFSQPEAMSVVMNRDFSGSVSQIMGDLVANGQVFLLNPAGVVVGNTGMVDTGGLLLSDMTVSLEDFRDDAFTLSASRRGGVVNRGDIRTGQGGLQVIAASVDNQGGIRSSGGDIGLTVGDEAVVSLGSSGRLGVKVRAPLSREPETLSALINNTGDIVASGSDVHLTASYLANLDVSAINNDGLVNAIAVNGNGGRIFLTDRPVNIPREREQLGENVLADLDEEVDGTQAGEASAMGRVPRLDDLVADCNPEDQSVQDCRREDAIKHYLGRLLINGRLPPQ